MIPATNERSVTVNGALGGAQFGISLDDSAHIMTILRDTLYSDKIMAVLREYSANAWDAHRMSGKADLPIKVRLPTYDEPTLTIQDFGPGLSRDDVYNIYTQYGASTKRSDNAAVGMLGIGSKSGFAYSDTFTVTSCHGGTRSIYSAMLDPSDKGIITLVAESPCGDETGITIQIPVKEEDFFDFESRAGRLYIHFDPRPDINLKLPENPGIVGKFKSGVLFDDEPEEGSRMTAVMGCVPYRLDWQQVRNFEEGLPGFAYQVSGILYFDIGEVHINASREELKYSDKTKRAILDKLNSLVTEYVKTVTSTIRDPNKSDWEKRIMSRVLGPFRDLVPDDVEIFIKAYIDCLDHIPKIEDTLPDGSKREVKTIILQSGSKSSQHVSSITVASDTRLLIRDDKRGLKGFGLTERDYVVSPGDPRFSVNDARQNLTKMIEGAQIAGIPVMNLSDLTWTPYRKPAPTRPANMKHGQKFFIYKHDGYSFTKIRGMRRKPSDLWEVAYRVPSDDDVYVEIEHFEPDFELVSYYTEDCNILGAFNHILGDIEMPEIVAYKITKNDGRKKRKGTHYLEWRKQLIEKLYNEAKFQDILNLKMWSDYVTDMFYYQYGDQALQLDRIYMSMKKKLGESHVITSYFNKLAVSQVEWEKIAGSRNNRTSNNNDLRAGIEAVRRHYSSHGKLEKYFPTNNTEPKLFEKEIQDRYELFSADGVSLVKAMLSSSSDKWIDYVSMVDGVRTQIKGKK